MCWNFCIYNWIWYYKEILGKQLIEKYGVALVKHFYEEASGYYSQQEQIKNQMKKLKNVIMIIVILICISTMSFAHGGNITGWKDKDSKNITEYNGKYYDIVRYVKQCEADLRLKTNSDKVKIGKNAKKTEKKYLSNKNALTYIDYSIGKQLADGAEVLRVSAVDVKNNT